MNWMAITAGGYGAAAVFLWLWIGAQSDIKAEIERCNTEKLAAVQEATEALRESEIAAYEERIAQLEQKAADLDEARRIASEAATEAQNRPERVRTVVREVTSRENCLSQPVPAAVIDSLRD
jgi:CHASE3 domain sensor protein